MGESECLFRLMTTVVLGMEITDGKILFCHGTSGGSADNKITTIYYNNRIVHDYFNNTFSDHGDIPYLNLTPITSMTVLVWVKYPAIPLVLHQKPSMLPLKSLLLVYHPF